MRTVTKQQWHELFIYFALWLMVFLAPLVSMYLKASNDSLITFSWSDVVEVWCSILPFFILFLVHNFLLAPRLLLLRRTTLYISSVVCLLVVFHLFQWYGRPLPGGPVHIPREIKEHEPYSPQREKRITEFRPHIEGMRQNPAGARRHPRYFLEPAVICLMIAVLMLGFNIAVKLLFKSQRDEEVLKELERQNLQQELEYLKYQINPHFFMNTLNNIHALVDLDTKKAKTTILELSKLMRYVLYEGSNRNILLSREVGFLHNYIALMRLRYTDKVSIVTDIPAEIPEVLIPPLLFISFVENAFKHGISYQVESFIRLSLKVEDGELFFRCVNSNCGKNSDPCSGIGLENVRKRLKLLYENAYRLHLEEKTDTFGVLLVIPVTT